MPFYVKQGQVPNKRHIAFEKPSGELYREELFSTHGFSNIYSNKYHHNMPTKALTVEPFELSHGEVWQDSLVQNYKLDSKQADRQGTSSVPATRFSSIRIWRFILPESPRIPSCSTAMPTPTRWYLSTRVKASS